MHETRPSNVSLRFAANFKFKLRLQPEAWGAEEPPTARDAHGGARQRLPLRHSITSSSRLLAA